FHVTGVQTCALPILRQLVDEVEGVLGIDTKDGIEFVNAVEPGLEIDADSEQLFRVLTNLSRNAVQAMSGDGDGAVVKRLTISARSEERRVGPDRPVG